MAAYGITMIIKVCSNRGIDKVLIVSYGPNLRLLIPLAKKNNFKITNYFFNVFALKPEGFLLYVFCNHYAFQSILRVSSLWLQPRWTEVYIFSMIIVHWGLLQAAFFEINCMHEYEIQKLYFHWNLEISLFELCISVYIFLYLFILI